MFKAASILFMYLETPLHAGSGTSLGVVDLPIQREKHTGFPMVQASGVKGAIRAHARDVLGDVAKDDINTVFGPDDSASEYASALALTDARLLLFPVRSLAGVFAWTTCPTMLNRLRRELTVAGGPDLPSLPQPGRDQALVPRQARVVIDPSSVVLEEFTFAATPEQSVTDLGAWIANHVLPHPDTGEYIFWAEQVQKNLVILPDDAFRDFVQLSTDVVARIRIDPDKGTAASGGLWYEECLPPESVLWTLAMATDPRSRNGGSTMQTATDVLGFVTHRLFGQFRRMQFGGDETIGRGLVNVTGLEGQ
jgi:CRISPR-associated protein Cmr4